MKHLLATAYFLFCATVVLPTTTRAASGLWVSIVAGMNASTFTYSESNAPNDKWKIGILGGASAALQFSDNIALRVEGLYSEKGSTVTTTDIHGVRSEYTTTLSYIDIPINAVVLLSGKRITPYLFAGPVFSIKAGEARTTINGQELPQGDAAIKPLDMGATFGIGVRIPVGQAAIELDTRYTAGLLYIDDNSTLPWDRQHSTLSLTARYSFAL